MTSTRRILTALAATSAVLLTLSSCSLFPQVEPDGDADGGTAQTDGSDERGTGPDDRGSSPSAEEVVAGLSDLDRDYLVEPASTTWNVTYTDDTHVIAGDALDAVTERSADQTEFIFDAAAARAAGIAPEAGQLLLLAGDSLVRVDDVSESGGRLVASTTPASLNEAIEEGTVGWDAPISFDFDQLFTSITPENIDQAATSGSADTSSLSTAHDGAADSLALAPTELDATPRLTSIGMRTSGGEVIPVADSDEIAKAVYDSISVDREKGSVDWEFSANGNKYQFRLTSHGDSVDVLIVVSRHQGEKATMAYRAEGSVGSVRSVASAEYADGSLSESDVDLDNLAADLTLSATAAGAGSAGIKTDIPVPFLKFTWLVGPIPVTLEVKADIIGAISASADASASATASFNYRGGAGVSFTGGSLSAAGETISAGMEPEPADSAAPMGVNVDAQYGVAFPHVSLSILGQGLVPYVRPGFVIGSSLTWGGPAAGFPASSLCKEAYVRSEVVLGYDLTVLDMNLASGEKKLYEDENRTRGDSCPDEG